MGMIKQTLSNWANYLIVGLFAFVSILVTTNSHADNKQDIAELEAFYSLVFDKSNAKQTKKITQRKTLAIKKQAKLNTSKTEIKDPELVAFYKEVFGNESSTRDLHIKTKPIIKQSSPKPKKRSNTIKQQVNPAEPKETNYNPIKELPVEKLQVKSKKSISVSQNNKDAETPKIAPTSSNNTEAFEEKSETKELNQGTGILDNNLLSSQVQKSESKASSKFSKTSENKNKKRETSSSSPSSAPANDMASLFAKAFGKKTAIAVPSNVNVEFRVNTLTIGEIELFRSDAGIIELADTKTLLTLLEDVLKDHVYLKAQQQLKNEVKTRLIDIDKLDINATYNSKNLSLDLEIKPELRKPRVLSLANKKKATVREENKVEAQKVSGFLNAFSNIGINSQSEESELNMRLEGSLNINGVVFETTSNYLNETFDFGRTTLTYDKPEKLQRISLGNISTGSRNFQENLELDGLRISKEYFLDPDLQISPRANESLQLDTDSEVELYINNQLIRRFYLNAGVYSLQDIGLYNGANNIRIRIKDEFGKVTVKSSQQYYDSQLLKPGLSLFAISVGYLSNQQSYSNSELEKSPIFSGYYQKGISEDLTLSFDAQLSTESFLVGAESISSIAIGTIKNSIAVSGGENKDTGYASSFEFKPNKAHEQISLDTLRKDLLGLDTRSRGLLNSWSITGEYRSEEFSVLNGLDPDLTGTTEEKDGVTFSNRVFSSNKLRSNLQTNFNLNISDDWQGTLNLGLADYYDSDNSYYANLSASRRFNNGTRLSLGARYDTEDEFSMNLQLSIPLSRKKGRKRVDLDVLADSRDSAYETRLNIKPTSFIGENSLGGSLEHYEDEDSRQENLDLQYRSASFESKFTARNYMSKGADSSSQQFNLGFNTAIACVGGSCAPSYPINDSFALVSGPSNQKTPIALSNNGLRFRYSDGNDTGLPDNYTALISGKGKKAVVRLDSYRVQNINIDEGTLPNGYDSEKTEFSVFPKYHQGFLLKAGGEPATTLDGMLFDNQNKVLPFKGGQWIPVNTGKTVAFFSNKGGKFRVTSIPAGKYKLELFDYPDMEPINIVVPDTKGKTHDIGKLVIKTAN